jgi:hypothetical protein
MARATHVESVNVGEHHIIVQASYSTGLMYGLRISIGSAEIASLRQSQYASVYSLLPLQTTDQVLFSKDAAFGHRMTCRARISSRAGSP